MIRQQQLKQLVAAADARWAAKSSVMDQSRRANPELAVGDGERDVGGMGVRGETGELLGEGQTGDMVKQQGEEIGDSATEGQEVGHQTKTKEKENPWKRQEGGAARQGYQPEAWMPGTVRR